MIFDFDISNFGEFDTVTVNDIESASGLRIGETMVLTLTPESRVSRFFSGFASSEESLKSKFETNGNVLGNLGVNNFERRSSLFQNSNAFNLIIGRRRFFGFLIGCFAFIKTVVVQPTALLKSLFKDSLLRRSWVDAVLECFLYVHAHILHNESVFVKLFVWIFARFHPTSEGVGFPARLS